MDQTEAQQRARQRCRGALEGGWLADAEQVAHQQIQVEPRDVHRQAFEYCRVPAQVRNAECRMSSEQTKPSRIAFQRAPVDNRKSRYRRSTAIA